MFASIRPLFSGSQKFALCFVHGDCGLSRSGRLAEAGCVSYGLGKLLLVEWVEEAAAERRDDVAAETAESQLTGMRARRCRSLRPRLRPSFGRGGVRALSAHNARAAALVAIRTPTRATFAFHCPSAQNRPIQ